MSAIEKMRNATGACKAGKANKVWRTAISLVCVAFVLTLASLTALAEPPVKVFKNSYEGLTALNPNDGNCAEVVDLSITPENPVKGDVVTVSGKAQPNERVRIDVSFEKSVPVQEGRYEFSVSGVQIPSGDNRFTVIAEGCDDLKVSVKVFFIWVTLGAEASNGVAKISRSAPPGTYDIVIHGRSSRDSVKLKITATGYVDADENGVFRYSYKTSSIPPGEFVVSAGSIKKTVVLREHFPTPSGSGTERGIAGGGGSAPSPASPAQTNAPTSTEPVQTPVPTAQATETPAEQKGKPEKQSSGWNTGQSKEKNHASEKAKSTNNTTIRIQQKSPEFVEVVLINLKRFGDFVNSLLEKIYDFGL